MLNLGQSDPSKPVRVCLYSEEGVGKTTFGAKSDRPVFITPENGVDQVTDANGKPVQYLKGITTWTDLRDAVKCLTVDKHDFGTVVVDSADWVESLAHKHIIGTSGHDIIRVNSGYGSGYRDSQRLHSELIADLSALREKRDMNIIITAHAHVKTVKDPSMLEDYDAFEIKCHHFVSSLWREWVDALLFAKYTTFMKPGEKSKARALTDGTRTVYTTKQPSFQAKNRYGLPSEMAFTENYWNEFYAAARKGSKTLTTDDVKADISELTKLVKDETLLAKVNKSVADAGTDIKKLTAIKGRLVEVSGQAAQY